MNPRLPALRCPTDLAAGVSPPAFNHRSRDATGTGGETRPVPGLEAHDLPAPLSADGRSLLATSYGGSSGEVYRFELASGKRKLWKELAPADRTGLILVGGVIVTPDAKAYAYYYETTLSDLYLAQGLM